MKQMSRRAALMSALGFAAGLYSATGAFAQAKTKVVELKKLFPYLDLYYRLPAADRSRFQLVYQIKADGKGAGALQGAYLVNGQRSPIRFTADGRVLNPPPGTALNGGQAELSAPTGAKLRIELEISPLAQPAAQMEARDLAEALSQARAAIRKGAGVLRFAAPKMERVVFKGASGGQIVNAAGKATPLPVVAGSPVFDPSKAPDARWIRFTRPPSFISLGPAK